MLIFNFHAKIAACNAIYKYSMNITQEATFCNNNYVFYTVTLSKMNLNTLFLRLFFM